MKAEELRLENLIKVGGNTLDTYQTYNPTKVTLGILKEIAEENADRPDAILSVFQPIPLTEEWLLKFGFKMLDHSGTHFWSKDIEINNGNHPDLYLHFHIRNNEIVNSGMTSGEVDNEDGYENERTHLPGLIEYVHQLQNFYFVLTGEELQ